MNRTRVRLPFSDIEIEQLEGGQPVTEAADFLQKTIIENTATDRVNGLELGSGNGVISFMLALQKPNWTLTGIELQPELAELSISNNARLGLRCSFRQSDLREYKSGLDYRGYGLVYTNPPWVRSGSGKVSPDPQRAVSRQEVSCTLKDILACVDWCLNDSGTAWLIYPLERQAELAREMNGTDLEAGRIFRSEQSPRSFVAKLRRKPAPQCW
jgi:tRNA1(Val) A37 N6-methylase TrmN6